MSLGYAICPQQVAEKYVSISDELDISKLHTIDKNLYFYNSSELDLYLDNMSKLVPEGSFILVGNDFDKIPEVVKFNETGFSFYELKIPYRPYGTDPVLDKLVDSQENDDVYKAIDLNYGLDKIVAESNGYFDLYIAETGKCLQIFVNSKDDEVRRAVAEQGYGLDKLVYDKNAEVSEIAFNGIAYSFPNSCDILRNGCENFEYYVKEWQHQNPDKCALSQNRTFPIKTDISKTIQPEKITTKQAKSPSINK